MLEKKKERDHTEEERPVPATSQGSWCLIAAAALNCSKDIKPALSNVRGASATTFQEATKQMKSCSRAAGNILPGLESADGVDLRDIDDGSQGFQSGAAALANLPRQSASVKPSTGHFEHCYPFPKTAPACPKHWEMLIPPMRPMPGAAK